MRNTFFTAVCLLLWSTGYAQHEHHQSPMANQTDARHYSPDKSNFPVVPTSLPVSRPQALAKVKPTGKRVTYDLVIDEQTVTITGKPKRAMTINGGIPGPTMRFKEGDVAVIRVHNKLKTETSLHWHGILLPNKQDGVSYLNTPPIHAGDTYTFEYPLVQSGTYWFHSHTRYQEQVGVYGSIAIQPQKSVYKVDHDLVLLLSDWTDENPAYILKNLKRRNEWYSIKKGNVQSLNRIIQHKAVGAYLRQSMMKMAPMDISDVYYDRFLINGKDTIRYPDIKAGQTVRLRVINASASTYFHLNYAGGPMKLIAADGLDVQPVDVNRRLIAIAETYDFVITVPQGGAFEVRASAQDGSGYATALLGTGPARYAPTIPRPDLYKLTANMSRMGGMGMGTMNMGKTDTTAQANMDMNGPMMHNMAGMNHDASPKPTNPTKPSPKESAMGNMDHSQMPMGQSKPTQATPAKPKKQDDMAGMDHTQMDMSGKPTANKPAPAKKAAKPTKPAGSMGGMDHSGMNMGGMNTTKDGKMDTSSMNHGQMDHSSMAGMDHGQMNMGNKPGDMVGMKGMNSGGMAEMSDRGMSMMDEQNTIDYSILKSPEPIVFPANHPIREIPLTLTGNMFRYIWGFNGQPLSRADMIQIRRGEIVRMRLMNNTMMMHPIHLHGHYFRVLNGQGQYSPLKHTVNVSPMENVTIEFMADDDKDWFFHCHLLYHMLSGMARVVSYGDKPDSSIANIQKLHLRDMRDNQPFVWGYLQPGYPLNYFALNVSNNKNAIVAGGDHDWRTNRFEFDLDYERYLGDWFRVFAGIDGGNEEFLRRVRSEDGGTPVGGRRIIRPVAGIRYMLPFLIQSEVKLDTRGNVRFQLSGQQMLFPRLDFQYQTQWLVGGYVRAHVELQYTVTKNLFLHTDYDTRYKTVAGGLGYNF
ncbi:multicopper oxidase domain-containing protein [Fibrella sp. HMF5335]|uniref:Multicopper oxidase domain-containing protein n=1 Tax=Fibrella rubiginis TaxID=2817060 RepID=A0A939GMT9_9BACT|nr:multicopper oxidase domain-containing protein [Fibrella rubiginis]MBO0939332.1 multicopper oxidase domain-containing protein [Fibrella rubiginis]